MQNTFDKTTKAVRFRDLILIFLKIGSVGFGGGVGMLAILRKYIIVNKRWATDDDLATAVTLGQMIPGPFIPNYVQYLGFKIKGTKGMIGSVIAFLFPGFLSTLIFSYLYFHSQQIPILNNIFAWIQPIIIGILAWASFDMARLYLKDLKAILIAVLALGANFLKISPVLIFLICGVIGVILRQRTNAKFILILPLFFFYGTTPLIVKLKNIAMLSLIFLETGAFIFGGGYAAIPFIEHEVVTVQKWLTQSELLAGVAISQITPGPVALLATFVGYKVSGIVGAIIATIAIFLPSLIILAVILGIYHRFIKNNRRIAIANYLKGFISGVKPAIVGFLISATIILGSTNNVLICDCTTSSLIKIGFALVSFILLIKFQISPAWLIFVGAGLGFVLSQYLSLNIF
ncbi:MAG: chromate efflux transporter [candidate division WOR-3 bacterium]|nr:chromate efflux transporter [candidate division WOR-3 bacterium]